MDAVCFAFRAGPTRRYSLSKTERPFQGGDGLVSSLLIGSLVVTVPIVLFIIGLMGNDDYWELVTHYIGGVLLCGVAVYIYWIVQCCKWIRAKRRTHSLPHHQFNCSFHIIKLLILFSLCLFSVIDKIQIINDLKENDHKYQAYAEIATFTLFDILQTVFFSIASLGSIIYKAEIAFEKTLKLSICYSINVLCNVAIGTYVFWKELSAFRDSKHETNLESLTYTMDIENALFCIALLSDLLYEETETPLKNSKSALDPVLSSSTDISLSDDVAVRNTTNQSSPLLNRPMSEISCSRPLINLVLGLVSLWAIFQIAESISCFADTELCLINGHYMTIVANVCSLIIIYLGCFYLRSFMQKDLQSLIASEIFLLLSSIIFSAHWVFSIVPVVHQMEEGNTYNLMYFIGYLLSIVEIFYQTTFIVNIRRARQKRENADRVPRRLLQMLAVFNFALWFDACMDLSYHGKRKYPYGEFYGRNAFILRHTFFSVGIFYRFHSFTLLMELSEHI